MGPGSSAEELSKRRGKLAGDGGKKVKRWVPSAACLLLCACMASTARLAVLPTDLAPRVGPNYQPGNSEERDIWQNLDRVEETIRTSPQRLIAPALDAYIHGIVERLVGRPAPELRIYVMHDASLNAAMLPSGMMIVNTGLLARVRNEAQLAAVLGHEAGHYFRKHALDLYHDSRRKAAFTSAAASALLKYDADASHEAWMQLNQAILMSNYRFSRDLESEADAYGLTLMARAGYPPRAASEMWGQFTDERRASATMRGKRFTDGTSSAMSTHPPTQARMVNLADTADYLAGKHEPAPGKSADEWADMIGPYRAMLLQEQIYLNDPGASLYLLDHLARGGWTGLLQFDKGEVYRLRNAEGDDLKAAAAYAAATALADAPPEAWRAHGYSLLQAGRKSAAIDALERYLAMKPDAPDAAMIRVATTADETRAASGHMTAIQGSDWKKLPAIAGQTRWEEMWTWNGSQLDRTTLVDGLPEGKTLVFQEKNADQQVPAFRADMTVLDLVSMVEVSYRVNGVTAFQFESIEPVEFLGGPGARLRYDYASGIGIAKKGDCVMRVVDRKLYAMKLESVAGANFDTVAPGFDQLVAGARLNNKMYPGRE